MKNTLPLLPLLLPVVLQHGVLGAQAPTPARLPRPRPRRADAAVNNRSSGVHLAGNPGGSADHVTAVRARGDDGRVARQRYARPAAQRAVHERRQRRLGMTTGAVEPGAYRYVFVVNGVA